MGAVLRAGKQAVVMSIDYRAVFETISHSFLHESSTAAGVLYSTATHPRIVKAIYTEASGMVCLRLPSRQTSEEEDHCCFASSSGHGRRVARVGLLPVRLHRVSLHQRRRRRGGHRMAITGVRSRSLGYLWRDNR